MMLFFYTTQSLWAPRSAEIRVFKTLSVEKPEGILYIYLRSGLLFLNAAHTVHTPISIIILVIYFCIYDWKYTQLLNTSCRRIFVACHRDWQLNSRVHCSQGHAQYEKFLFFPQELIANVPLLGYFIVFVASLHYSLIVNTWMAIHTFIFGTFSTYILHRYNYVPVIFT